MKKIVLMTTMLAVGITAVSAPVCSMLATRSAINSAPAEKWVNPYITDGLIAMWDGIESKKGVKWQNLVRNSPIDDFDAVLEDGKLEVVENGYKFTSANYVYGLTASHRLANMDALTIEVTTDGMSGSQQNAKSFGFKRDLFERTLWRQQKLLSFRDTSANRGWNYYKNVPNMAPASIKHFGGIWADDGTTSAINNGNIVFTAQAYADKISPNTVYKFYLMKYWAQPQYADYTVSGTIYCCRVYNRILTAEEIAHNYAVDRERFNLP